MSRLNAALVELAAAIREEVRAEVQDAPPELLSIAEAARRAGIGRTLLYRAIGRGEIRTVKVGRRRLVPADAVAEIGTPAP